MGLRNPETRAAFDLVAKYLVIFVAGLWTLYVGTDYLDSQTKALKLGNVALGVASVPTADTTITFVDKDDAGPNDEFCYPQGKYAIENTGQLAVEIEPAVIKLYEVPTTYLEDGQKTVSWSLDTVLSNLKPILLEKLGGSEVISIGNSYERVFAYTIRRKSGHSYVLVANAAGGIPENAAVDDDARAIRKFGPNDLRHVAQFGAFC